MHAPVPDEVAAIAATQDGVVSLAQATAAGMSPDRIRSLLRAGIWRRVTVGVYLLDADLYAEVPRRAIVRAALLRHGPEAILWGATAAEVLRVEGVAGWPGKPWVMLPLSQAKGQPPDARLRFRDVCPSEVCIVDGFPITAPVWTLGDLVSLVDRPTGLSLLDSALHGRVVEPADLEEVCRLQKGRRGAPKVRELAALADELAATPLESRVRLACIDGGVPPDALQWPVHDQAGILLGYADMAWLRNRRRPLVAEADGEQPHSGPTAVFRDRYRHNDFSGAAVDSIRFTWVDAGRPSYIQATVRRALAAG